MNRLGRDYLKVGMYTEMIFPNADIRFIAINNGVDSDNQSENDMTPFINIFNEFYAKDTSRFQSKGTGGKADLHESAIRVYQKPGRQAALERG